MKELVGVSAEVQKRTLILNVVVSPIRCRCCCCCCPLPGSGLQEEEQEFVERVDGVTEWLKVPPSTRSINHSIQSIKPKERTDPLPNIL